MKNSKGSFTFTKATDSGYWVLGDARKKMKSALDAGIDMDQVWNEHRPGKDKLAQGATA